MRKSFVLIMTLLFSVALSAAEKLPKKVDKARQAVASVLTYKDGQLKGSGTAVLVGSKGDVLVSYGLMYRSDSAVVIDAKGKARPVTGIVGLNSLYDCVRMRVGADKKLLGMPLSATGTSVGDELYMLAYGNKGTGAVTKVKVSAVDSLYSNAYYTLDVNMQESYESLPLVNADGELVAVMQPMAVGDSCSYAIASTITDELVATSVTYGRGYYNGIGVRTLLPEDKESALSCLYMQAVVGDSLSFRRTVNDFIAAYPNAHEGYMSRAEYMAVYCRDMDGASADWGKALSLGDKDAEVYFNKAKVIYSIVQSGDTVSHKILSKDNAFAALDKAIELDAQPLYINYKADALLENGMFEGAYECYVSLAGTSLRSAEVFARAAQCQGSLKNYGVAVELMDSAIGCFDEHSLKEASPYILTRALLKYSAGRYREAVFDYNRYEEVMGAVPNANFYYMRSQAEVKGKMFQQALNDLERAISIEPGNAAFYLEKGLLCYKVNLLEDGALALEDAKKIVPDAPDVYYIQGCIYFKAGNKALAVENLQKAVSLGHPDAQVKLDEIK